MSDLDPKGSILVIDDDAAAVDFLVESLSESGFDVRGTTDPEDGLRRSIEEPVDLVIADVEMPALRGVDLLGRILAQRPGQLVLLVTAFGTIDLAMDCVRAGACDFITKPFRAELMEMAVRRALRERRLKTEIVRLKHALGESPAGDDLVVRSAAMRRTVDTARRAASSSFPVLLTGESGTGKSRLARFIHDNSPRCGRPFLSINCSALPLTLVEGELFGVRRGAYTDAVEDRAGMFVEADGGTLFLDEIGDLPLEVQPKLLHVLETGSLRAVGARSERKVDVRIVAATNRDLEEALRQQRFRPDLYFRLNVIRLEVPGLRERADEIPELVELFLSRASARSASKVRAISTEAMRYLASRPWPGNVRELANVVERAVALAQHDVLVIDDVRQPPSVAEPQTLAASARRRQPLDAIEREYVRLVVDEVGGNISEAARVLGIDRRTLYKKLADDPGAARARATGS